ncbi:hypothetical protein ACIQ6Y_10180 [Streptomyces sp. NPDC096205]|uniref:hypothetical protein n=1 Tax=Streptomyces sp. NPDC096205 TaxID=3366081 RepID=UPI003816C61F
MALDDPHPVPGEPPAEQPRPVGTPQTLAAQLPGGDEHLPCGRTLSHAWEQARDTEATADPHTTRCPYCRQAVEGLAALDRATRALRSADRPDGRSLADRVMTAVRAELRLVTMTLATALDEPLADRAAQVRRAVLYAAEQGLGLAVAAVDLKIDTVLGPADTHDGGAPGRSERR